MDAGGAYYRTHPRPTGRTRACSNAAALCGLISRVLGIPHAAGLGYASAVRSTLCTVLLALVAVAAFAGAPQEHVRQTVDAVSAALNDPQLQGSSNEHARRERVAKVMHDSFDFRTMAQESLGPQWASLTPEQRDRFVGLFTQLFERSYDRLVLRFLGGSATTYGAMASRGKRVRRAGGDRRDP